ncbi:MAG: hypothetical protein ABSH38_00870 [Verrucomicrobiota bacterium]|jgi:hypothetical protein
MKRFIVMTLAAVMGAALPAPAADDVAPPAMPHRDIAPPKDPPRGETVNLKDGDIAFTLFLPAGWQVPPTGETPLTVHFHGAAWFAIDEHLRHGLSTPLLAAYLGEGSSVYQKPFADRERFDRWLQLAVQALRERGAPANTRISAVDVTSFSAGYGAVRELLKSPKYSELIRRIVLSDSMYASLAEGSNAPVETPYGIFRQPARDQIDVWVPFARAAARGEKTFVLTVSEVPTAGYASSGECAAALIRELNAPVTVIAPLSSAAASDPDFPLKFRADLGNFHIWGYGGTNAQAHMNQVRHMADVWLALDARK